MATFRALRLHKTDSPAPDVKIEQLTAEDLSTGNVLISNEFSSLNYKDALAVTGKGKSSVISQWFRGSMRQELF